MSSVAEALRRDTYARVMALSVGERVALSLALGDDDVARYAGHAGLDPELARRHLRTQHAHGRRPSAAADGDLR